MHRTVRHSAASGAARLMAGVFALALALPAPAARAAPAGSIDLRLDRVDGVVSVPQGAPAEPHVSWVRAAWEAIRSFSTGGNYVNFHLAEDDTARTPDAYRNNYERLPRVKAQYDPANLSG